MGIDYSSLVLHKEDMASSKEYKIQNKKVENKWNEMRMLNKHQLCQSLWISKRGLGIVIKNTLYHVGNEMVIT